MRRFLSIAKIWQYHMVVEWLWKSVRALTSWVLGLLNGQHKIMLALPTLFASYTLPADTKAFGL